MGVLDQVVLDHEAQWGSSRLNSSSMLSGYFVSIPLIVFMALHDNYLFTNHPASSLPQTLSHMLLEG